MVASPFLESVAKYSLWSGPTEPRRATLSGSTQYVRKSTPTAMTAAATQMAKTNLRIGEVSLSTPASIAGTSVANWRSAFHPLRPSPSPPLPFGEPCAKLAPAVRPQLMRNHIDQFPSRCDDVDREVATDMSAVASVDFHEQVAPPRAVPQHGNGCARGWKKSFLAGGEVDLMDRVVRARERSLREQVTSV